jgi:hypothetical protein
MLTVTGVCPIPTNLDVRIALRKRVEMLHCAPKGIASVPCRLIIGTPEDDAHIDTASGGAFEHVQCGAATVRHQERWPHECHRRPNALLCSLDCLADATEGRLPVDPRPDVITAASRIGTGVNEWR